ncbi:MAG: helicase-related protein [Marinifilaceae bacterium]
MNESIIKPGNLITLRGREWVVLPSDDKDLLIVKPLGGSDEEITAIYKPLRIPEDVPEEAKIDNPSVKDINDFETAKLLFDATRLSFRNASGPFRCMGKLSFRPRSYQMVPLVMALKQDVVRLLIADDVGIGKTVEALMILKEMMERGEVKTFAVICLPHLCEQWQKELKDKLDIEAEIIRSSTAASLDRKLPDDQSVFYHVPFQVISIDYVKAEKRRGIFLNDCPDMVIVDEAHTCAKPKGSTSAAQQQRYHLLNDISNRKNQHLLLLTATPHSGKDEEFQSLLGLLKPEFAAMDLNSGSDRVRKNQRTKIARHFIQRKRDNIRRWGKDKTPFPERETREVGYYLSTAYMNFYTQMLHFARGITLDGKSKKGGKLRYWTALALLRGVMSSPAAGLEMLENRKQKRLSAISEDQMNGRNLIDRLDSSSDASEIELMEQAGFSKGEVEQLDELTDLLKDLHGQEKDRKAKEAVDIIKKWLKEGYNPIIFCRYIATAKYLGELIREALPKKVIVKTITSELADEQRKEQIDEMAVPDVQRVLIATDCLSEGINLQDQFTAVLHYDLPWNPNRLEQREGRVDRFGQKAEKVMAYLLWGEDNPIDSIVLKVLIRKVRDIQRTTGVSISLGDENKSIMDAVLTEVLIDPKLVQETASQMSLDFGGNDEIKRADSIFTNELEQIRKKAENLRSIFAHERIKEEDIETDLNEVDEAIGDIKTVEEFVKMAVIHLGARMERDEDGYILYPFNLPEHLKARFNGSEKAYISFESPTPEGYQYIGRNHRFVEQLCHMLMGLAFEPIDKYKPMARAAVIQTEAVETKTTLVQFRVRNVIREVNAKREVISEEMYLWGYSGSGEDSSDIEYSKAKKLLLGAQSVQNIALPRQEALFEQELNVFNELNPKFNLVAEDRAENLVKAHCRFKELVGGRSYEAVHPVLPPDVMGIYILLPKPKSLF